MKLRRILALALAALLLAADCAVAEGEILYDIEVDLVNQIVTVYRAGERGSDDIVRRMICSGGSGGEDATPTGTYKIKGYYPEERGEWYYIQKYKCYVRYPTRINGPYLFHSLPYAEKDRATLDEQASRDLGRPVSHGCIRLRNADAQWIAENCPDGTSVHIFDDAKPYEALRERLLRRSYDCTEWPSYLDYLHTCNPINTKPVGEAETALQEGEAQKAAPGEDEEVEAAPDTDEENGTPTPDVNEEGEPKVPDKDDETVIPDTDEKAGADAPGVGEGTGTTTPDDSSGNESLS